jgi:hypothetical protein
MPSESSAVITDAPETDAPLAPAMDVVVNRDHFFSSSPRLTLSLPTCPCGFSRQGSSTPSKTQAETHWRKANHG